MSKQISLEEIKKLAKASRIFLEEEEIPLVANSIGEILNYVKILNQVDVSFVSEGFCKNVNIFRPDLSEQFNPELILKNAPEEVHNSFVVPAVIKKLNK